MNEDDLRKLISLLPLPKKMTKPPVYVLPADEDVNITTYPACIIRNTNKTGVNTMGHWLAFYLPTRGTYEYMDSYGLPLNNYPNVMAPPGRCVAENCYTLQANDSYLCGHYCAFFPLVQNAWILIHEVSG